MVAQWRRRRRYHCYGRLHQLASITLPILMDVRWQELHQSSVVKEHTFEELECLLQLAFVRSGSKEASMLRGGTDVLSCYCLFVPRPSCVRPKTPSQHADTWQLDMTLSLRHRDIEPSAETHRFCSKSRNSQMDACSTQSSAQTIQSRSWA
jgi:hypothetical protein